MRDVRFTRLAGSIVRNQSGNLFRPGPAERQYCPAAKVPLFRQKYADAWVRFDLKPMPFSMRWDLTERNEATVAGRPTPWKLWCILPASTEQTDLLAH